MSYACGYVGGATEKGDLSFVPSKLISDEALAICAKLTGVDGLSPDVLGDASVTMNEEEFAEIAKIMEDDQADIKTAVYNKFLEYFKKADEEGKGLLLGDVFKTVLADMEGEYNMSFLTERAQELIAATAAVAEGGEGLQPPVGEGDSINYEDFLRKELKSPRDLKL